MTRLEWLKEKRAMAEKRYDTLFAADYDDKWGQIEKSHEENLRYFLSLIPKGSKLLDAACGTGKYWTIIASEGFDIVGIDQSQRMLNHATAKNPNVWVEKRGLQEICYENGFYGITCIDAMENVFPEDWPIVLTNFQRALKKGGYLYFTVEIIDKAEIKNALKKGIEMGLPIIEGEYAHEGGYHYYPSIEKVKEWIDRSSFKILKENASDGYHHFIIRK